MAETKVENKDDVIKALGKLAAAGVKLYDACKMQQRLINDMIPVMDHVALPDHALLNDAQIAASKAISLMEATCFTVGKEYGKCPHLQKH